MVIFLTTSQTVKQLQYLTSIHVPDETVNKFNCNTKSLVVK